MTKQRKAEARLQVQFKSLGLNPACHGKLKTINFWQFQLTLSYVRRMSIIHGISNDKDFHSQLFLRVKGQGCPQQSELSNF